MPKKRFEGIKIDKEKLIKLRAEGKTQSECAKIFDVTVQAVSKMEQRMRKEVVGAANRYGAHRIVQKELHAADQLTKINEHANQLLDTMVEEVVGEDGKVEVRVKHPELMLKTCAEIRGQLKLQLEIFQSLYDLQANAEFQEEVLTIIGELEPEARRKIVHNLNQRKALRRSVI